MNSARSVAQSRLDSVHVMELTTHMHARTHAWKLRGGGDVYIQRLQRVFFPTIASNWQEEMHRANGGKLD